MSVAPPRATRARRRPAWLPALAALFFAGLTFWLGQWQLGRAEEKRAKQADFDVAATLPALELAALPLSAPLFSRVRVTGQFEAAYQIYLDNRLRQGQPGYHVIVPLAYPGGVVLVNRGWLAAASDRAVRPDAPLPSGWVTLEGLLVPAQSRYLELSEQGVTGPVWQNLSLARYREWYRGDLPDRMLLRTSPADDGLLRDWPRPDTGVERHLGYAVQWFAMTAAIFALYAYYGLWRRFHAPT
ncbi:MAG: SURF1 family protein [Pseudomonadota bacterium]|nr:SURF1 family protein [Pseudomonadota bacterium]MDP1903110.1 SURF1 family protein [Pseudomonadota bacterium]MDP2352928.1 SURF1 family protein [Pseudomonadota bacterium]